MPSNFMKCDMTTELTDAELAKIVRGAASAGGVTPQFEAIAVTAECRLEDRHEGDCASWQADLSDHPGDGLAPLGRRPARRLARRLHGRLRAVPRSPRNLRLGREGRGDRKCPLTRGGHPVKIPKHLKQDARRARAEGWTITVTGGGHLKWSPPRGQAVIAGSTPQERGHGPRNARRALARAGLGSKR